MVTPQGRGLEELLSHKKSPATRGKRGFQWFHFRPSDTAMNLILAEEAGTAEEEVIHSPKTLETRNSTSFQPTCLISELSLVGSSLVLIVGRF